MRVVAGTFRRGGNAARWRAFVRGGEVVLIEERVRAEGMGTSVGRYWFADGRLFLYARDERREVSVADTAVLETRFAFDSAGALVDHRKTVEGRILRLAPIEARMVARHAAELRATARRTAGPVTPTAP